MKKWLEIGNRYAEQSSWKDFALTKLCLCAMGVLIGMYIPAGGRALATAIAGCVFLVTYVILMAKLFRIVVKKT